MRLKCLCNVFRVRIFRALNFINKERKMKKILFVLLACCALYGCCKCESEPIIEANHALIVPRNFGNMPK